MQDSLGDRMKLHEAVWRDELPPRTPVLMRVDGRAFHSYLSSVKRPWDPRVSDAMAEVAKDLVAEISGAEIAYQQSDEISILIHPYKKFSSQCWCGGNVQKMVSIAASVAATSMTERSAEIFGARKVAHFDARVFILPESEVTNYFVWRQRDAQRNSSLNFARSVLGHAKMQNLNTAELAQTCRAMGRDIMTEIPAHGRNGLCVTRGGINRTIPIFSDQRSYIEQHLKVDEQ